MSRRGSQGPEPLHVRVRGGLPAVRSRGLREGSPGSELATAILSQYAATLRAIAILVAAAPALPNSVLSMRTSVRAERGRVVVWQLPLLRHVKVEGQETRRPSARELAQESDDDSDRT